MPLSKQHKAATRERIVASAGRVFRARGAQEASVAAVMADAGLTHGGFYAHFASKQDLLREVLTHDHGFIRLLARRTPAPLPKWRAQTARVFADYLHPDHLAEVGAGCSFAALTGDAARAAEPVRAGYRQAWERLVGEVLRGPGQEALAAYAAAPGARRERAAALAGMAIGAVSLARVLAPGEAAAALLRGVAAHVAAGIGPLLAGPEPARAAGRSAPAARRR
ncbi:MAG: TetR family transcriptional regulator [Rubrivivax sp.]|nr:TetR family transcriptional regulator [Rubrivivax sp.]